MKKYIDRWLAGSLLLLIALLGGSNQALALPFAYVGNANSNNVSAFSIGTTTGISTRTNRGKP